MNIININNFLKTARFNKKLFSNNLYINYHALEKWLEYRAYYSDIKMTSDDHNFIIKIKKYYKKIKDEEDFWWKCIILSI